MHAAAPSNVRGAPACAGQLSEHTERDAVRLRLLKRLQSKEAQSLSTLHQHLPHRQPLGGL